MAAQSMKEILSTKTAPSAAPAAAPVAAAEEPTGDTSATPANEDASDEAEEGDEEEVPTQSEPAKEQPNKHVPREALIGERKKRQQAEQQLAELRGRLSALEQMRTQAPAPTPKPEPKPEFDWTDPDGYVEKKVRAAIEADRAERWKLDLEESTRELRAQHEDYPDAEAAFLEASRSNPVLVEQFRRARNPAKFAYDAGKTYLQVKDVGSLDDLRERIRTEERAKIEAELKAKSAELAAAAIPTSNAGARGSGAGTAPAIEPKSLKDILGR